MANILIFSLVFPPDNVSTAHIMGDLASDLKAHGHTVCVLTTVPHYNRDEEEESKQPIFPCWGPFLKRSRYRGIPVFHTLMPRKGSNVFLRLVAWLVFHALSTVAGFLAVPKPDVIIAPSPPLTMGLGAWMIGTVRHARFIYNVQEVYPDIAIRLGALRGRLAISFLHGLESFIYRKAARVTVISGAMRTNLLKKNVPKEKIDVIPNFVDFADFQPMPKDNAFSRAHAIHNKFIVSYAGNMGVPQGLDTILETARLLRDEPDIVFMMIGDGMRAEALRRRAAALALPNLVFLPYQPYSLVPQIYSASDANLVPQTAEAGFDAVPSKVYRIMASAGPVIAITESTSDLARLVLDAGCGTVVPPGRSNELAAAVQRAHKNPGEWRALGLAGRRHVQYYSRKSITDRYDRLVQQISA